MFSGITVQPLDPIMGLMAAYREDQRLDKLDLGIGVYRAPDGTTPIMSAVKQAQRILGETETTKTYLSPLGDPGFTAAITQLVLGEGSAALERTTSIQTPGGSGALALGAALLAETAGSTKVLVPDPTWVNHPAVFNAAGLAMETYPYLDRSRGVVDIDAMLDHLGKAAPGSIVLLHGCCHNPSGADIDPDGWRRLADVLRDRDLFPFIDLAYQGLGDGVNEDAFGVRHLLETLPEALVAVSCSKNFAIYRERTGLLMTTGKTPDEAAKTRARLAFHARGTYSMPPDHGAAIVRIVLEDSDLRAQWKAELDEMRERIMALRSSLAETFRLRTNTDRFDFLENNKGMFSLLGIPLEQILALREKHGIYIIDDGRINVAGLRQEDIGRFADAVIAELTDG